MKKISLALLFTGLIFSQLILIAFNVNNGFEFHKVIFRAIPIAEYAGKISMRPYLTSSIIGYIAFVIFGVLNTNKIKAPSIFKSVFMYTAIAIVVTFFEFTSILEDFSGTYEGKYFGIGWLLFLLGLWIFSKQYLSKK